MFEKRIDKRSPIELAASCGIGEEFRHEMEAKIYNMSSGGFCFGTDKALRVGEEVQLAVDLDVSGEVVINVRVVWVKKDEPAGAYTVGVQIVEKKGPGFDRFMEFYNNQLVN